MKTKKRRKSKNGWNECRIFELDKNILFFLVIIFSAISLACALTFVDNDSGDFGAGTYNWTFYNSSGFIQLNSSRLNGTYTSQVFNANSTARWNNISWTSNAIGELPNNQAVETSFGNGNANMTGNVLLMHFNNQSAFGENATHAYDFSGSCYDNETQILTENGWKYFKEIGNNERVMTLNGTSGEVQYENFTENKNFDSDGEMFNIITDKGNLSVSRKHKVYVSNQENFSYFVNFLAHQNDSIQLQSKRMESSGFDDNQISPLRDISNKSFVEYTLTKDCSLKCGSFDQIAELVDNASARYGESLGSRRLMIAFDNNTSYSDSWKNSIDSSISFCLISNSCSDKPDLIKHSSLYLFNSCLMNSGAEKLALIEKNKYAAVEYGFIIENKTLLSNTSFILNHLYSSLLSGGINLNNSFLLFSGSSFNSLLNESFLALLPKSTDHLINSCSSSELNLSISSCLLSNSCLTSSDQTIQDNFSILDFNLSSNANVMLAIYSPLGMSLHFSSSSIFLIMTPLATSATFTSGKSFLNLANNSSGTDTVILGIFNLSNIYFNTSKDVDIYKSLYFEKGNSVDDSFNINFVNVMQDRLGKASGERSEAEKLQTITNPQSSLDTLVDDISYQAYNKLINNYISSESETNKNEKINTSNFKLQKITDVYSALQNNPDKEIYFLDSDNKLVKVKGIEKGADNVPDNVPDKRQAKIIELIRKDNSIVISEIARLLFVNEKTIKRDIEKLKKENKIKRIGPETGGRGYWEILGEFPKSSL